MVGSALVRKLEESANITIVTCNRGELDLTRQEEVEAFFAAQRIDWVYLAAARVGGIKANNDLPADFIRENLQIQTNVIHSAHTAGVDRMLFLGSSCIYPRLAVQPVPEEALMSGPLETTNEAYAVAKIAGIKMCESYRRQYGSDFRSVMPPNLYGPNDNFNLDTSHVLPALLRKFHSAAIHGAESVTVWGSGRPRREFLHVDEMAEACCHIMNLSPAQYWSEAGPHCTHTNIGSGTDISIKELAGLISDITGFSGQIKYDTRMPDGTPRKSLDISRLKALGWQPQSNFEDGIRQTYAWMVKHWKQVNETA
jgi:GDP-L-fucose synthase